MALLTDGAAPKAAGRRSDLSPYLIGATIGVLSWVAFAVAKEPLGVTTALSRSAAPVAALVLGPDVVAQNPYWAPMPFSWDYGVLFLVGLMGGAFISSLVAGTFHLEAVPRFWRERFGDSVLKRFVGAFSRWRWNDVRRAACGGLHKRPRHIGDHAVGPVELALPDRAFR